MAPFVKELSVNVSILTLTVISVDRYHAVVRPLSPGWSGRYHAVVRPLSPGWSGRTASVIVAVVWAVSVLSRNSAP